MNDTERDDRGRFTPQVSDDELLKAVRENEPAGTAEVGDAVGLARQNADYRLRRLQEDGSVRNKKVGRSLVWMLADPDSDDA